MLYVFHGTDTQRAHTKAQALVSGLVGKRPGAQVFHLEGEFALQTLDELVQAQGLFVEKHIVYLHRALEDTARRDYILARVPLMASTQNIFVMAEGPLLAAQKKIIEKHAEKNEEFTAPKKEMQAFNIFALGDYLGARDRKNLWVSYIDALRHGNEAEAIHGTLFWAMKSLRTAQRANSAEEVGQKPFVYQKFKRYAANFTEAELAHRSHELVALYHDAHRGKHELATALERWVLTV